MAIDLEGEDGAAVVLRELRLDYPEVYELVRESIETFRDMHDIRRASLRRRMQAQLRARPGAAALVDDLVASLRLGERS